MTSALSDPFFQREEKDGDEVGWRMETFFCCNGGSGGGPDVTATEK